MLSVPTLFGSIGKKAKRKSSDFGIPACWNREFVIECSSVDNDGANGRGTIALFGTLGIGEILLNDPPPISGYPVAADRVGIADDRVERRRGGRERFYEQAVGPDGRGSQQEVSERRAVGAVSPIISGRFRRSWHRPLCSRPLLAKRERARAARISQALRGLCGLCLRNSPLQLQWRNVQGSWQSSRRQRNHRLDGYHQSEGR